MNKIEKISGLTQAEFNRDFYNKRPFVDKKWALKANNYKKWDPEYLVEKIGHKNVNVSFSESGIYNYTIKGQTKKIEGFFSEMMDYFTKDQYDNKSYYLQQTSIHDHFPELLDDLNIPSLISDDDLLKEINLWVGGKGCLTPLHYDQSQNFLMQIRGEKEIILYSPEDTPYLYPRSDRAYHISQVDLNNVDTDEFPLFSKAVNRFEFLLEPGDMLYIPPGWWHQVHSLTMSISVNYWFHKFDVIEAAGMEYINVEDLCAIFQIFMSKGVDINHIDLKGENLLIKAIFLKYQNFVTAFLKMGANPNSISQKYVPGASALDVARMHNADEIADILLGYGANSSKPVSL